MGVVEGAYLIVVLCSKICKKEEKRKKVQVGVGTFKYLEIFEYNTTIKYAPSTTPMGGNL